MLNSLVKRAIESNSVVDTANTKKGILWGKTKSLGKKALSSKK